MSTTLVAAAISLVAWLAIIVIVPAILAVYVPLLFPLTGQWTARVRRWMRSRGAKD